MTLSLDELKSMINDVYPDAEQVDDSVLRFTKRMDLSPFAVCFVDISGQLPSTQEKVAARVEQIIGPTYFDQPKSVQWNHYLYFVVDDINTEAVRRTRPIIEQDTTYARKFVMEADDFERALRPTVAPATDTTNPVDAISIWTEALRLPHLVEAIFGNYTRAQRVAVADGTTSLPDSAAPRQFTADDASPHLPPLRSFNVTKFRKCIEGKAFQFGDVNLLVGTNGSGKTSTLEAIELYYCGKRTKRNHNTTEEYEFNVEELENRIASVTHDRPERMFRERNRDWYGVRELRRTMICDSFGRFNFLNTDAAVDLGKTDDDSVNEDLARLVVGSEAAAVWPVIEQLAGDVTIELRRARGSNAQDQSELESIRKQLVESATIKTESDTLQTALTDALNRNRWHIQGQELEREAGSLAASLSATLGIARQAIELSWIDAPTTLDNCRRFTTAIETALQTNRTIVDRLESLSARQAELATSRTYLEKARPLAAELEQLVKTGIERRTFELTEQRRIITEATNLITLVDDKNAAMVAKMPTNRSVAASHSAAMELRRSVESRLVEARANAEQFATVRERSIASAQELRQLARQIITPETADECPLCHTKFERGELNRRMSIGVDAHEEAAAQKLLSNVTGLENEHRLARLTETALRQITRYCKAAGLLPEVSLGTALADITGTQKTLNDAQDREEFLSSEIDSLQRQGVSLQRLNAVRTELSALGFGDTYTSSDDAASLHRSIQDELGAAHEEMKKNTPRMAAIRSEIAASLKPWGMDADDPHNSLAKLEERHVATQQILAGLEQSISKFPWDESRPIGEWVVEAERVQSIAVELQTALGMKRVAATALADSTQRVKELKTRIKQADDRIARLRDADSALQDVLREHSLEALTRSALQESHSAIEAIFSQIHSPTEFESIELNGSHWELKRDDSDQRVKLTQVSTGQRAAFALSVFLAQNAELSTGPPVILIDDPIAYVDDLNSLSFLDYLREIALTGKRQIFFATASDKLASLFERKFDFMGDRFRRFDLERDSGLR